LQSRGFESPREAAQAIDLLQKEGKAALAGLQEKIETVAGLPEGELDDALRSFALASS